MSTFLMIFLLAIIAIVAFVAIDFNNLDKKINDRLRREKELRVKIRKGVDKDNDSI